MRTVDINENKLMDSEKIGTIMLVMKNIMDSLKPILYSNILYLWKDLNEPNTWNPFNKERIFQLAVELNLIESDEEKEQRLLEDEARMALSEEKEECLNNCNSDCEMNCKKMVEENDQNLKIDKPINTSFKQINNSNTIISKRATDGTL